MGGCFDVRTPGTIPTRLVLSCLHQGSGGNVNRVRPRNTSKMDGLPKLFVIKMSPFAKGRQE